MPEVEIVFKRIAQEMGIDSHDITKTVELIDEGNTIPFIARYRKEITGNMTDESLRTLYDKLTLYRNFEKRKADILRMLTEKEILSPELAKALHEARNITELEDIYRPYRPKKRTRAVIAREKGLQPLADYIMLGEEEPERRAKEFVDEEKEVFSAADALQGARDIIAEVISDDPGARRLLRELVYRTGFIVSRAKGDSPGNYEMYANFREKCGKLQPHRVLALNRGEKEGFLQVKMELSDEEALPIIRHLFIKDSFSVQSTAYLHEAITDGWKRLLYPSLEREVRSELTEKGEEQALKVFKDNLKNLLMVPPVSGKRLLAIDPGIRTGSKVACVDETGKLLDTAVIFPIPPHNEKEKSAGMVMELIRKYDINAVAIGNGTGCREIEEFVTGLFAADELELHYTIVNEAGASVYSASKLGQGEFPGLDVAERSAVSIARRLQDPLSELVKIDPRSIGVGQYQHDVNQKRLKEVLDGVVESCVNQVGVDLNTASASLLGYIAGLNKTVAANIVHYREENGSFKSRKELQNVPKLGPAVFKQCAGFLRIPGAENYFDRSAVHPESYATAKQVMEHLAISFDDLGRSSRIPEVDGKELADELGVGELTLIDIIKEFKRPGRDPREGLPEPVFRKGILDIKDLREGMQLSGVVRNVVDFGAFVDIGVHQDGLVHISELSENYVRHPLDVVKVSDVVDVKVISVDREKNRIGLSMKT